MTRASPATHQSYSSHALAAAVGACENRLQSTSLHLDATSSLMHTPAAPFSGRRGGGVSLAGHTRICICCSSHEKNRCLAYTGQSTVETNIFRHTAPLLQSHAAALSTCGSYTARCCPSSALSPARWANSMSQQKRPAGMQVRAQGSQQVRSCIVAERPMLDWMHRPARRIALRNDRASCACPHLSQTRNPSHLVPP